MIRTRGIHKAFDGRPVLRGVDLEVARGEIFGFVGPNGAGKSTFLKSLIGVVRADGGEAEIAGVDALRHPLRARREVGYAPGETALYHRMRASELVDFAIRFHPDADRARAAELLERFGLPPAQRVGDFSHGMKRKLLLAQALASGAPVMLLDEPMEGLDPEARRLVEGILREEAAGGRTVFFSSHDLASVERVCDRVAFLRGGRLLQVGTLEELLRPLAGSLPVHLREAREAGELPAVPGGEWSGGGRSWRLRFSGTLEAALPALATLPIERLGSREGGLEELFEALYGPEAATGAGGPEEGAA
jgi:ABC-2 type transport system ATP-binding protein